MDKLKIGIPNTPFDRAIFEPIASQKIKEAGLQFEFEYHDLDTLNAKANEGAFDVVKISFANWRNVATDYKMLASGSSLGVMASPFVIKNRVKTDEDEINTSKCTVAIPGRHSLANLLFTFFYPYIDITQKVYIPNEDIEKWVASGKNRMGVLEAEALKTYKKKGLQLVYNFGDLWQKQEKLPVPVACVVAKKNLGDAVIQQIDALIAESVHQQKNIANPAQFDLDLCKNMGEKGNLIVNKMMNEIFVEW
jgi:1,4-dihydroxy-6-naphthoate synthase